MVKRIKSIEELRSRIKKHEYFGDYVVVAGIPYQIVEYSMESAKNGSRWVTYYNPYTKKEITIDYAQGTAELDESVVAWEKSLSLDMKWLKKGVKHDV